MLLSANFTCRSDSAHQPINLLLLKTEMGNEVVARDESQYIAVSSELLAAPPMTPEGPLQSLGITIDGYFATSHRPALIAGVNRWTE